MCNAFLPPPTNAFQVEADIRPFRGLLLGLFFVSVGSSINMEVFKENWDVCLWMLAGLVSFKAAVNIALGPLFGLTRCAAAAAAVAGAAAERTAWGLLQLAGCVGAGLPELCRAHAGVWLGGCMLGHSCGACKWARW